MSWSRIVLVMGIAVPAVACYRSDGNEGVGDSGLDRTDRLGELAQPDVVQFCDWGVVIGAIGFGEHDCGVEVIVAPSRDECVANLLGVAARAPSCAVTVGAAETCWTLMGQDPCTGFHAAACEAPPGCE